MGYIYLITNTINGKKYVGQTLCEDIESRWKQHRVMDKNSIGRYLLNAYHKYGVDKFKFKIVCICFNKDCNKFEEEYINTYNCLVPNGYNLKAGGKNSKHHPETIKKMSDALKGRRTVVLNEESRKKLSNSLKGERNPNFGKKMCGEQKDKIRDAQKKRWLNITSCEVTSRQLDALANHRELIKKCVGKYDNSGNLLEIYSSTVEAGKKNNISFSSIGKVCRGNKRYKTAAGFVWKYLPKEIPLT